METRKERYAKYRDKIRRMREQDFPAPASEQSEEEIPTIESLETDSSITNKPTSVAPYDLYLQRKRKVFLTKLSISAVIVIGFVIWGLILFLGR